MNTKKGAAGSGAPSEFQRFSDSAWKAFSEGFQKDAKAIQETAGTVQKGVEGASKLNVHWENTGKFVDALQKRAGVQKAADSMAGEARKQTDQFITEKKETFEKLKTLSDPKATPEKKGEIFGTWAHDQVRDAAMKKVGETGHKAFHGHVPKTAHEKVGNLDAHYTQHKNGQWHVELKEGDKTVLSGKLRGRYDYENAHHGPLRGDGPDAHGKLTSPNAVGKDATFSGYRYLDIEADGKHTMHRAAGKHEIAAIEKEIAKGGKPTTKDGGDFLTLNKPESVTSVRSETAVRRGWPDRHNPSNEVGKSDPTHTYQVRPPAGTPVCVGVTSNMGKGYEGGGVQVVVPNRRDHAFEIVGRPEPLQRSQHEAHAVGSERSTLAYEHHSLKQPATAPSAPAHPLDDHPAAREVRAQADYDRAVQKANTEVAAASKDLDAAKQRASDIKSGKLTPEQASADYQASKKGPQPPEGPRGEFVKHADGSTGFRPAQNAAPPAPSAEQPKPKGFVAGVQEGVAGRVKADARVEQPGHAGNGSTNKLGEAQNLAHKGGQLADPNLSSEAKGKIVGRELHDGALRAYHERAGKGAEELGKRLGKKPESGEPEKEREPAPKSNERGNDRGSRR